MTYLIAIYLSLFQSPTEREVAALLSTAPECLTPVSAMSNLIAARAASVVHRVSLSMLLAIAHHESCYRPDARTPETHGRESCGVMTPIPVAHCNVAQMTLAGGYDAGAEHLELWQHFYQGRALLLAYAGGGGLVHACTYGPWITPRGTDACAVARVFQARATRIARALEK